MWQSLLQINKPLDTLSLYWAIGVLAVGLFAMWRSRPIVQAMRQIKYPPEAWWRSRGFSHRELEDAMTLYARLFAVVWIGCGLFWIHWVLYHQY